VAKDYVMSVAYIMNTWNATKHW